MALSGSGNNSNEENFIHSRSPELMPHHQMQFSIIPKTALLGVCVSLTPQRRRHSDSITNSLYTFIDDDTNFKIKIFAYKILSVVS